MVEMEVWTLASVSVWLKIRVWKCKDIEAHPRAHQAFPVLVRTTLSFILVALTAGIRQKYVSRNNRQGANMDGLFLCDANWLVQVLKP